MNTLFEIIMRLLFRPAPVYIRIRCVPQRRQRD